MLDARPTRMGRHRSAAGVGRRRRSETALEEEVEPSPLPEDPSAADIARAARFPVYLPVRPRVAPVSLAGSGWRTNGIEHVSLHATARSKRLWVESYEDSLPYTPLERARMRIVQELIEDLHGTFDDDPDVAMLERREARRRLGRAVDAAGSRPALMVVGRRRREFVLIEHEGRWVAAADGVVVSGRNVAPEDVALRRLRPDDELASSNVPQ
jgi:hypothetical protein